MKRGRWTAGLAALLFLVGALAGCSPVSIGSVSELTPPRNDAAPVSQSPVAFTDDALLFLALGGSTSCPVVPTSLDVSKDGSLRVHVDQSWCPISTADARMITYELPVDDVPTELTLVGRNGDETLLPVLSTSVEGG